jgi:hypothetical protein
MTCQLKHTPTPYKAHCLGSEGYNIYPIHEESLSELKAECGGLNDKFYDRVHPITRLEGDFYRQKANAEFITRVCNSHEELLKALKNADEIICSLCYKVNPQHASQDYGVGCKSCQERDVRLAIIKQAEEGL